MDYKKNLKPPQGSHEMMTNNRVAVLIFAGLMVLSASIAGSAFLLTCHLPRYQAWERGLVLDTSTGALFAITKDGGIPSEYKGMEWARLLPSVAGI